MAMPFAIFFNYLSLAMIFLSQAISGIKNVRTSQKKIRPQSSCVASQS
jgi:hypothetical protein